MSDYMELKNTALEAKGNEVREGNFHPDALAYIDFCNNNELIGRKHKSYNLADNSSWVVGTNASQGDFAANGLSAENKIIEKVNPWGELDKIWASESNDSTSDADGGFNLNWRSIDHTKGYRYSIWIKRENVSSGGTAGRTYFGCGSNSVCGLGTTTTAQSNPYFFNYQPDELFPHNEEWLLIVSYIRPSTDTSTTKHHETGVYDIYGNKIYSTVTEYKWVSGFTSGAMRSYLYYSTATQERQYWCDPRMEMDDGTLVPIHRYIREGLKDVWIEDRQAGNVPSFRPTWTCYSNCAVTNVHDVYKSTTSSAWDGNFKSTEYKSGDMYIEWSMDYQGQTDKGAEMVGLFDGTMSSSTDYKVLDYAIYCHENGRLHIYEDGTNRLQIEGAWDFSTTKRFRIEKKGMYVKYYYGGELLYESTKLANDSNWYMAGCFHCHGTSNKMINPEMGDLENYTMHTTDEGLYIHPDNIINLNRHRATDTVRHNVMSYPLEFPIEPPVEPRTGRAWTAMVWNGDTVIVSSAISIGEVVTFSGWYLPYTTNITESLKNTRHKGLQMYDSSGSLGTVENTDGNWNEWVFFKKTVTIRNISSVRLEDRGHDYESADAGYTSAYLCNLQVIKDDKSVPFTHDVLLPRHFKYKLPHYSGSYYTVMGRGKILAGSTTAKGITEVPQNSTLFLINGYDTVTEETGTIEFESYISNGTASPFIDRTGVFGINHSHITLDLDVGEEFVWFLMYDGASSDLYFAIYTPDQGSSYKLITVGNYPNLVLTDVEFGRGLRWEASHECLAFYPRYMYLDNERPIISQRTKVLELSPDFIDLHDFEEEDNLWDTGDDPESPAYDAGTYPLSVNTDPTSKDYLSRIFNLSDTTGSCYRAMDITCEANVDYLFTAEVYVSSDIDANYKPLKIEQATNTWYEYTTIASLPKEEWVTCHAVGSQTSAGNIRFLIYPKTTSTGSGQLMFKNVSVSKITENEFQIGKTIITEVNE